MENNQKVINIKEAICIDKVLKELKNSKYFSILIDCRHILLGPLSF